MLMFSRKKDQRPECFGFSLVELMIALVLGLLIIGGIITVFVSSQQSYRTKTAFDNAQEAFRFASHTITRVARSADAVDDSSGDNQLALRLTGIDALVTDCLGAIVPHEDGVTTTFRVDGEGNLECVVTDTDTGTLIRGGILVSGVESLQFLYGVSSSGEYLNNSSYSPFGDVDAPENIRAVRATITMDGEISDLSVTFTSAIRSAIAPDIIVIRPDE